MSMHAGSRAQMVYGRNGGGNSSSSNNNNNNNAFASGGGIGTPTPSFGSRGKGDHLKRLNAAASVLNSNGQPAPRTSRGHLLAGLRTAPRTPGNAPQSAPHNQSQFGGMASPNNQTGCNAGQVYGIPQTAIGSSFPMPVWPQYSSAAGMAPYSHPQVLAPPPEDSWQQGLTHVNSKTTANFQGALSALEDRQHELEKKLYNHGLRYQAPNHNASQSRTQYPIGVATHVSSVHSPQYPPHVQLQRLLQSQQQQQQQLQQQQQQLQQQLQQLQLHNLTTGPCAVYNQATGQYQYVNYQSVQPPQLSESPPPPTPSFTSSSPDLVATTPGFDQSPPSERQSASPVKAQTPPVGVAPASAFRRGHRASMTPLSVQSPGPGTSGPIKSPMARTGGFPQTPLTGTFGPGQARAGEHPERQPRGPPPLEELQAAPTTKHEGSKNFASLQRRSAVRNLVRAGIERRSARSGSGGCATPASEADVCFPVSSDNDSDSVHSGSLSSKHSIGSLRAAASGVIGSERKASRERLWSRSGSDGRTSNTANPGQNLTKAMHEQNVMQGMPGLLFTRAEKRVSSVS